MIVYISSAKKVGINVKLLNWIAMQNLCKSFHSNSFNHSTCKILWRFIKLVIKSIVVSITTTSISPIKNYYISDNHNTIKFSFGKISKKNMFIQWYTWDFQLISSKNKCVYTQQFCSFRTSILTFFKDCVLPSIQIAIDFDIIYLFIFLEKWI